MKQFCLLHSHLMASKLSLGLGTRPFEFGMQAQVSRYSQHCEAMMKEFHLLHSHLMDPKLSQGLMTIRVWDASTGVKMLPALQGHDKEISSVASSPDGSKIVSGSWDRAIRVWNASTGVEMLPALQGHDDEILSVAFSPDGSKIVSAFLHDIIVSDADTGVQLLGAQTVVDDISRSTTDDWTISLQEGWFIDSNTGCYLGRLPVGETFYHWRVHGSTYAGCTSAHRLIIICFPTQ
jgi:hypothetical protein